MSYNHVGIDYKIISNFIHKKNNIHKKKLSKYIGGVDKKDNELNDLKKILSLDNLKPLLREYNLYFFQKLPVP